MKIKRLQVTNLRVFEHGEFDFRPEMNLLVGVNGVGKTTLLDALRICLSQILCDITASRSRLHFNNYDIRNQADFMTITCTFRVNEEEFSYVVHRNRDTTITLMKGDKALREETLSVPNIKEYKPPLSTSVKRIKSSRTQPVGVFFGVRRSLVSDVTRKATAAGGQIVAFANALYDREVRQQDLAAWILAQEGLGRERPLALKHLRAMQQAADSFMPHCQNLRVDTLSKHRLVVDKDGKSLEFRQLSDGERGMFVLALEIAKRLSQANPYLEDPIKDGSAIILIDEIDLHLHPKWQRTIVSQLKQTFPNCQFIATTHSPFIIQSLSEGELINVGQENIGEYADKSIDDIAENVMGIEMPQKSERYKRMMKAAEEYYALLYRAQKADPVELAQMKQKLEELSAPYSDDPAFSAFLKFQREYFTRGKHETGE